MTTKSRESETSLSAAFPVGTPAPEVIRVLTQMNEHLERLIFSRYLPAPSFDERLAHSENRELRNIHAEAQRLRDITGIDLLHWESIVAATWPSSQWRPLFAEAVSHDPDKDAHGMFHLAIEEIVNGRLQQELVTETEEVLALCSICHVKGGGVRHIPLMDFHCLPNQTNLEKVKVALSAINQSGVILESGRSYHFYGIDLLDHDQWLTFMAKALLLAPFTDSRYIAHRLLGGKSVLRISKSRRKPQIPFVVGVATLP
jgi:hypothetical protein